jgi:hypothetical protein
LKPQFLCGSLSGQFLKRAASRLLGVGRILGLGIDCSSSASCAALFDSA